MAQVIKSIKQKLTSGSYSNPIPLGANGVDIDLANGYDLEATLGTVDVANKGTVQDQLNKNATEITGNDIDIANLQSRVTVNETNIATHSNQIADRYTKAEIDALLKDRLEFETVETW